MRPSMTRSAIRMSARHARGLLDTNILILQPRLDPSLLPDEVAVSTITLAELSAGVHSVRADRVDVDAERARRIELLQRVESAFDPIPFGIDAARAYGLVSAAVRAEGRSSRRHTNDLMIAAIAAAEGIPVYTSNPRDFVGADRVVEIVPVPRPGP